MSEVFRIHKTKDFTVMSNHHLRNARLTLRAKGLLSLMLSLPPSWDYSLAGLAKISREGTSAISAALKELEWEKYLIRSRIRNGKGQLMGTEYSIYEQPISAFPNSENPILEKPTLENPNPENQPQSSTYELNTEISNMQELNIHQSIIENKMMDAIDRNSVSKLLKDNISYDALAHDYTPERIDELVHTMTDAYCSTQLALRIGNEDIPLSVVKSRIMKLNMEHIRYVLFALSQNKTKVHNIKSYLLTCLYNAPATISHFYQAAVSHDLYHSLPEVSQANVPTGT